MPRTSKNMKSAYATIDRNKAYDLAEAVALVKGNAKAKFDETIEISMNLSVDPRHADQMVRGVVAMPNGTGKSMRVVKSHTCRLRTSPRAIFDACQANRKSPTLLTFPAVRFLAKRRKGITKKLRPPHIKRARLGGRATSAEDVACENKRGTVVQSGIKMATHIKALASAPP